ncbi:hypothetical protein [Ramlibacter sp.]|uniref:hypothetical protein n=1 Tax=Ramlibacter sp. TaxID=1917967 RepID=UPI0017A09054|nr:hypothetical protein [Ramlibacter sp.]MBA2675547.1 hypothetical protein [Ramlibacter sp.]
MSWARAVPASRVQRAFLRVLVALCALFACATARAEWGANTPYGDGPVYRDSSGEAICAKYTDTAWAAGVLPGDRRRAYFKWNGGDKCEPYAEPAFTTGLGGWILVVDCAGPAAGYCSPPTDSASSGFYFGPASTTSGGAGTSGGASSITVALEAPDIFKLTPQQGTDIAGAILALWAAAYAIRMVVRALKSTDGESTSESE